MLLLKDEFKTTAVYQKIIKPLLFLFAPERVHYATLWVLEAIKYIPFGRCLLKKIYCLEEKKLARTLFGLHFKNPVGLAAGFDKNAAHFEALSHLGFGFIEIGTVTTETQKGNPQPRLFRLPKDKAIINRMGFNNDGVTTVIKNLKKRNGNIIIGGNIGKNTHTPPENYTQDYCTVFEKLHPYVDYFVLNISCPNVGSHEKLQDKNYLMDLIKSVQKINGQKSQKKPILIKIAPDLNRGQLDEIIALVLSTKIDGVIATNTSIHRSGLQTTAEKLEGIGNGGLSGAPIKNRSTEVIRYLAKKSNKAFPIIGLGGIHSATDALEKINAGADLIQVYTGLIYEGPLLVKKINALLLDKHRLKNN